MPRAVVIHFEPAEAAGLAERIRRGGCDAEIYPVRGAGSLRTIRENPPDAVVIDLMRMPSYGRWMATLLRENQSTRRIPLVFVEGDPEKARLVRKLLPDAVFTTLPRVCAALEHALRAPPSEPVAADPTRIPAAGKLKIREGSTVALLHAPKGFRSKLKPLPEGVRFRAEAAGAEVILLFVKSAAGLGRELPRLTGEVGPGRTLWVVWPKKSSGLASDITVPAISGLCSALGMAPHKVCAVDKTWSALAIGRRRSR